MGMYGALIVRPADPNIVNNGANENTSVGLNTHLPLILR
jgi:hypothetical protein